MEPFCTRLKAVRGCESQASFAKKIGVSQVAYGRYELGVREPDLATLVRIGLVGHISLDWLLGLTDNLHDDSGERKFRALKDAMQSLLNEF